MNQTIQPVSFLKGTLKLPPDKSIAQRAALFSLLSEGYSHIHNYPEAEDPQTALQCIRQLGAIVDQQGQDIIIKGTGRSKIQTPHEPIDCRNSGTIMRLLAGILAGAGTDAILKGDDSLSKRPMKRIIDPLRLMGCSLTAVNGTYPPLHLHRNQPLNPIRFSLPVPSAQLKSCVLLAGLFGERPTEVVETVASRNHTEIMLRLPVKKRENKTIISASKNHPVPPQNLKIPGDFSAAAFWLVAGSVIPQSEITLPSTGINPTRSASLKILQRMGADIESRKTLLSGDEPVSDLIVRSAPLKPTEIKPEEVPNAIDELPVLSVAMAFADGVSKISGAGELRYKESDRLAAMETILRASGVDIEATQDDLTIYGKPGRRIHAAVHDSRNDHRIAMSAAILSLCAQSACEIRQAEAASVSYPDFWQHLDSLSHF